MREQFSVDSDSIQYWRQVVLIALFPTEVMSTLNGYEFDTLMGTRLIAFGQLF